MVQLINQPDVMDWINGTIKFEGNKCLERKIKEDKWGRNKLKSKINTEAKQWSGQLAEELFKEYEPNVNRARHLKKFRPDFESDNVVYEIKCGSYNTTGTAMEKILGCPFKYADIPVIYEKPLVIVCVAQAELACRNKYGLIRGHTTTQRKERLIRSFEQMNITIVGFSELVNKDD